MNDHFEADALDYLLEKMEPARRLAFERELQRDAAAREALKRCADSLGGFAREVAPAESLSAPDDFVALRTILTVTQSSTQKPRKSARSPWWHLLWPAAAIVLFALNLVDFDRPFGHGDQPRDGTVNNSDSKAGEAANHQVARTAPASSTGTEDVPSSGQTPASGTNVATSQNTSEFERLRSKVAELQQTQDRVQADYDRLVRRIAEQAVTERELNRLTTMELVDSATYTRGERKGLVGIGRGVLIEPGVVTPHEPPPSPTGTSSAAAFPYAWSVFDEKEHRGYLNLYQLPSLSAEQSMQVWMRPTDTTDYQHIAEVPSAFQGRNGSLQYVLPSSASVPAEILVTIEPRNVTPTVPTGPTILRGP